MKKIFLGTSDFKKIIENNGYFVDKSLLISEIIDSGSEVILFPRPRRFGKTLNMSMLKYYFDKNEAEQNNLFEKLKIWKTNNEIKKHYKKYPVINLSFKDAKADNWEKCYTSLVAEITNLYKQHIYLLNTDILYDFEKSEYNYILRKTASETDYQYSIKQLSDYLQRYYKEKVVILVDEYDAPIQAGYKKYYDKVISFMRNLLSGAFKYNSNLYKGVITGILRVSKESIFSGLNNLSVCSVLDSQFSDKFGFTEPEVKLILKDFEIKTDYAEIKKWYNGYKFGKTEGIYNPWSILNYSAAPQDGFKTYWINTSSNELIKNEIKKKDAEYIRQEILKLINNQSIVRDVEENFVFTDLDTPKEVLWTLLAHSGYLTIKQQIKLSKYELTIPNYELKIIFQKTVIEWLETDIRIQKTLLEETANYLIINKLQNFEKGFKKIIGDTFSYYDDAQNHEYVYQSYLLGLLAIIGDDYIIKSNRESGEGRYDIMIIPHDKTKYGIVIEIKQIENQQEKETKEDFFKRINQQIDTALIQIDKNKYYKELIDNNIEESKIVKVPIVFAGKEPYILKIKD